jgi:hypothetical protein
MSVYKLHASLNCTNNALCFCLFISLDPHLPFLRHLTVVSSLPQHIQLLPIPPPLIGRHPEPNAHLSGLQVAFPAFWFGAREVTQPKKAATTYTAAATGSGVVIVSAVGATFLPPTHVIT